ncbi:MAG: hypothetical protein LBK63_13005 [Treponema sp.]|jgi:hypothetical protein|nr:hypothetical protein [Treponema sp.]
MKKNKRPFAKILFCLAIGAFFLLKATGYIREISGSRKSIDQHRKALNAERPLPPGLISRLEGRLAELREPETPEAESPATLHQNPENPAAAIRGLLRTHAVEVERLRTLSMGGSAATEFVLSGAPVNFLRFLQGAAELPLPLSYVSIKPNDHSSNIDVTVRYKEHSHEP